MKKNPPKKLFDRMRSFRIGLLCAVIGLGLLGARFLLLPENPIPAQDKVWQFTMDIAFTADEKQASLAVALPANTTQARVVSQHLQHAGLRLLRPRQTSSARHLEVIASNTGKKRLLGSFLLHIRPPAANTAPAEIKPVILTAEQREEYLTATPDIVLDSPEVESVLQKLVLDVPGMDTLTELIFQYAHKQIHADPKQRNNDSYSALVTRRATPLGKSLAMVSLLRASKIPARPVVGFILQDNRNAQPHYWVEVYDGKRWVPYDADFGYEKNLPPNFIPFRRGRHDLLQPTHASVNKTEYKITAYDAQTLLRSQGEQAWMDVFDLTRLNIDARQTLALLLLLPVGALVTTIFRAFVGIRSYGTFTPTLLALAMIYADWIVATVIFTLVISCGFFGRSILPEHLSRVPRLSIVFTIVAGVTALSVSLMDFFQYNPAGHLVLLPMVILTSLVDRFYSAADDSGMRIALRRMVWTLIIAVACFPVLQQEELGDFLLRYPELHFITIALILLAAAYPGPKLSDITGLHWLTEPKPNNHKPDRELKPAADEP